MWSARAISFVNGQVVGSCGRIFASIRVRGRRIDSVGASPGRGDVVIDLDGAAVFPGLINAHDHLELNSFPRLKWRERYCNVREWIADFHPRFASDPALAAATPQTLDDRLWVGALKNVLAGVTTVCHHNPLHPALTSRYPVRVVRHLGYSHSLGIDGDRVAEAHRQTPRSWPWIVHAAEGIDEEAASEIDRLDELGCLDANTVLVHGVALTSRSAQQALGRGAALIWCPTSNHFLFGATADVRAFANVGRLAVGSDSRLSGQGDLLNELRAAHETRQVSAESLFQAVSDGAARVLRLGHGGRLVPGLPADLCVIRSMTPDPLETLVSATRSDVRLTMLAGVPLVADDELAAALGGSRTMTAVRVDGAQRLLARWIADRASKLRLAEPGLEVPVC